MYKTIGESHAAGLEQIGQAVSDVELQKIRTVLAAIEEQYGNLAIPNPLVGILYAATTAKLLATLSALLNDEASTAKTQAYKAQRAAEPALVTGQVF